MKNIMPGANRTPLPEVASLIASDGYWPDQPVDLSTAVHGEKALETYFANINRVLDDTDQAQEIGLVALSLRGGGTIAPLTAGSNMPRIEAGSRQIVRVVEDSRLELSRFSRRYRLFRDIDEALSADEQEGRIEEFDTRAERSLDPRVLHTPHVSRLVAAGLGRAVRVERNVYYMRPDMPANVALCVPSIYVQSQEHLDDARPITIPALPIGWTYFSRGREGLGRIVRADLMEATGILWRDDAPKRPPEKEQRFRGLLPRLMPGTGPG